MPRCLIGLGSNLGDRKALLNAAIARLKELPQVRVVSESEFHETPPVGGPSGQNAFLNAAVLLETSVVPDRLLNEVGKIEADLGRRRTERWGPRPVDIDLLLYDDLVIVSKRLRIPHPRMAWRRFVLAPSAEIAPAMRHPEIGWTVRQLLDHIESATPYIAVAGPIGAGTTELAENVASRLGGRLIRDPARPEGARSSPGKSYGFEAEREIELAVQRAGLLDVTSPIWGERYPFWISDFWVGQSAAALRALSEEPQRTELLERWRQATRACRAPKLTALLDAPTEWCAERLAARGMPRPNAVQLDNLEAMRKATIEQACLAGLGPVLVADGREPASALEELAAAVLAMEP
ncbi:MAG: 2-amino-4-hydroxy-6-hydroxymethyldihydropteridine diphosphokinase [Planctomycetaceae bacterium]|nr:2-amino-4-hydroxy-6-hydroxymethyldihydropteridine diphosphokinase [Planctomycetaceae bacterium]